MRPARARRSRRRKSHELAGRGLEDANVHQLTGRDVTAFQHYRPLALPDPTVRSLQLVAALDQDLDVTADPSRRLLCRDRSLQRKQLIEPAQLLVLRDV